MLDSDLERTRNEGFWNKLKQVCGSLHDWPGARRGAEVMKKATVKPPRDQRKMKAWAKVTKRIQKADAQEKAFERAQDENATGGAT